MGATGSTSRWPSTSSTSGLGLAGPDLDGAGVKILVDAVSDAMFGWVSDNTRLALGRRRPFILIGGVLSASACR